MRDTPPRGCWGLPHGEEVPQEERERVLRVLKASGTLQSGGQGGGGWEGDRAMAECGVV